MKWVDEMERADRTVVDIVMPAGGSHGGVERVVRMWVDHLNNDRFLIRVVHLSPGAEDYLDGYEYQYYFPYPEGGREALTLSYFADRYTSFIMQYGAPSICVATWIPLITPACEAVRKRLNINMPVVSWVHSDFGYLNQGGWGTAGFLTVADCHLCLSDSIRSEIQKAKPDAKCYVIGNPLNQIDVGLQEPDPHTLCFVGRIVQGKRLDVVLKALSMTEFADWQLLIAGDGDLRHDMQKYAEELGLSDRVRWLGWKDDPWQELKNAVSLIISSDHEGFSLTALEASSLGMTVISTPVSGCVDYIVPDQNGYFFEFDKPDSLRMILDAISSGVLHFCDSQICRESVKEYYAEEYFARIERIFNEIQKG